MPRVTESLDYLTEPELLSWMLKTSKAKRELIQEEAKNIGTEVDQMVREDIQNDGYLYDGGDERVIKCLEAWEKFKKERPEFVATVKEMQVELSEGEWIGHPDFVVETEHTWGIVDLKCASSIRPKYWTQVAAYLKMHRNWVESKKKKFIAILRLDKTTGEPEFIRTYDEDYINYEVRVFEAYKTVYEHAFNTREMLRKQLEENL